MTTLPPAAEHYARHVNPAFVKLLGTLGYGRVFVRARGTRLWDAEGREYLDFLAAFGAASLGHNHPRLTERLREALTRDVPSLLHVGPQPPAGDLGHELARRVPELPMIVLAQSGGESVENALKMARAATKRSGFVHCTGGFHGTGFGALSLMGSRRMREPFEPLLAGVVEVPFGDAGALERALAEHRPAAFVVEPIQAEGGVVVPPRGYLAEAARLCRTQGTLLVLDEVQTGLGRTGRDFAFRHEGFVPDLLVLGKALGGSVLPISAVLASEEMHRRALGSAATFDLCSTTFAGYALGCRAAIETLRIVDEERLAERAAHGGERLIGALRSRLSGHPFVRDVRGRGLLVGIELGPGQGGLLGRVASAISEKVFGQWLAVRLLEVGILAQPASQDWSVLRLEPPLTVTDDEIDRAVDAVARILGEYTSLGPLVADVGKRLGKQATSGWGFG